MKRVGIITIYYGNMNYGGCLQAYALPYFLNKNGYDAKQILYSVVQDTSGLSYKQKFLRKFKESPIKCPILVLKLFFAKLINKVKSIIYKKELQELKIYVDKQKLAFEHFQLELTPHTEDEYNDIQLVNTNKLFDVFITGSDQVFNFRLAKPGYFLNFVQEDKTKFSYAASMALSEIPKDKMQFMKHTLSKYSAVSVREDKTVTLLNELTERHIELVIDPTLLLTSQEWDIVASDRLISEKYVICYFLGNNIIERQLAKQYAKQNNLKLVCIPMYKHNYKIIDLKFGDLNLPFASPEDFISLIKYADCIFTDSFHACVFSLIYKKQFVVFNRDKVATMSSRIVSLMKLFGTEDRYLDTQDKCTLDEVKTVLLKDTSYNSQEFEKLKASSIEFLIKNLE